MIEAEGSVLPQGTPRPEPGTKICLLTVHGIGINQERQNGELGSGYADNLQQHLRPRLGEILGWNPDEPGVEGPLYIVGRFDDRASLDRLSDPRPLLTKGARIAHVALVYTPLEVTGFDVPSLLTAAGKIVFRIFAYATPIGLIREGGKDFLALMTHRAPDPGNPHPSLRVADRTLGKGMTGIIPMRAPGSEPDPAGGLMVLLKQITDDFFAYLCRPKVQDEIVDFVQKALVRIADRPEIGAIVVNTHSQGTVATFDAITDLDDDQPEGSVSHVRQKVIWLITAGSPLRKIVDIFGWRPLLRNFQAGWTNFWDPRDPAADPLKPPRRWRLGMDPSMNQEMLFRLAHRRTLEMVDRPVSNVDKSSGGGLQAHNYWDNQSQFVEPVCKALLELCQVSSIPGPPETA